MTSLASESARDIFILSNVSYWDSPDTHCLLHITGGQPVLDMTIRCDKLLSTAAFDNDILISLLLDIQDINELSTLQRQHLRFDCLYIERLMK